MAKRSWLVYVGTYSAWAVISALAFWVLLVSRQAFMFVSARFVGDDIVRGWQARFYDKVFLIVVALGVLALVTLTESYLRRGIDRRDVIRRSAKIVGVELLVLSALDLVLALFQGSGAGGWLRWLILVVELVAGVALLAVGRGVSGGRLRVDAAD